MPSNKIVVNNEVLIDLTADTVTASTLRSGYTAHDKAGNKITGTMSAGTNVSATTATAADVLIGAVFYRSNGLKTNGTLVLEKLEKPAGVKTTIGYTGSAVSPIVSGYDPDKITAENYSKTTKGNYTASFTPKFGYTWTDETRTAVSVPWTIAAFVLTYYGNSTAGAVSALSSARNDLAAASVRNYALFGGGDSYGSDVVDAYDANLTRTTPTVLSSARNKLAAASVGNYALFGGGAKNNSSSNAVVDAYDANLTRTTPTVLSEARYSLAAASFGGCALFGGGSKGTYSSLNPAPANYSAIVDAYDANLARTTPTVLSEARFGLAAAVAGDYALFGGGGNTSAAVDVYRYGAPT